MRASAGTGGEQTSGGLTKKRGGLWGGEKKKGCDGTESKAARGISSRGAAVVKAGEAGYMGSCSGGKAYGEKLTANKGGTRSRQRPGRKTKE